jgi:hypothetical protein
MTSKLAKTVGSRTANIGKTHLPRRSCDINLQSETNPDYKAYFAFRRMRA